MKPTFDLIIPCAAYHSERLLNSMPNLREIAALKCVGQVIVVCDGWRPDEQAIDGVIALVLSASKHRVNNVAAVRNAANSLVVSSHVLFCDADVVPTKETVLAHAEAHTDKEWCFVAGLHKNVLLPGGAIGPFSSDRLEQWVYPDVWRHQTEDWRLRVLKESEFDPDGWGTPLWSLAAGSNISMSFDSLLAVGGWNPAYQGWGYEDADLWFRLSKSGVRCHWLQQYFYHQHHDVQVAERMEQSRKNHADVLQKQIDGCVVTYIINQDQSQALLEMVSSGEYLVEALGSHPLGISSPHGLRSVPLAADAEASEFRQYARGWFVSDLRTGVFPDPEDWRTLHPTSTRTQNINGVVYVPKQGDGIVSSHIIRLGG